VVLIVLWIWWDVSTTGSITSNNIFNNASVIRTTVCEYQQLASMENHYYYIIIIKIIMAYNNTTIWQADEAD